MAKPDQLIKRRGKAHGFFPIRTESNRVDLGREDRWDENSGGFSKEDGLDMWQWVWLKIKELGLCGF